MTRPLLKLPWRLRKVSRLLTKEMGASEPKNKQVRNTLIKKICGLWFTAEETKPYFMMVGKMK